MGFAISWLAVSGSNRDQVLTKLGLVATGLTEEIPESPTTCAALPSGWTLVFANKFDSPLASEEQLRSLSAAGQVVSCQVEEHVMYSSASCHTDGALTWRVEHDAQQSIYHLQSAGDLPADFDTIFASLKEQQDADGGTDSEVDYIHDVPVALADSIVGFRHDKDIDGAEEEPFEVVEAATGANKPWWKVW